MWFYPQEQFEGSFSGLSDLFSPQVGRRVADGEGYDATLPEAAIQALQLPIILRVTNLENGRSILVRAVDRGPQSPGRIIGLNDRSRFLLGIDEEPGRVRLDIDTALSQQVARDAVDGPRMTITAAPQTEVIEQPLGPATASTGEITPTTLAADGAVTSKDVDAALRTQSVGVEPVGPTALWVDAGRFSTQSIARAVADATGGEVVVDGVGRQASFAVDRGPFQTAADADAALNRARSGGITGSRIVVR